MLRDGVKAGSSISTFLTSAECQIYNC